MNWTWRDVMGIGVAAMLLSAGLWANASGDSVQQLRGQWSVHAMR